MLRPIIVIASLLSLTGCSNFRHVTASDEQVIIDCGFLRAPDTDLSIDFAVDHYNELWYLARTDHAGAIKLGIRLIASPHGIIRGDCDEWDELGLAIYDGHDEIFWSYLDRLTLAERRRVIDFYNSVQPVDWDEDGARHFPTTE